MDPEMKTRAIVSDLVVHSLSQQIFTERLPWGQALCFTDMTWLCMTFPISSCVIYGKSLHLIGSHAPRLSTGDKSIYIIIMIILWRMQGPEPYRLWIVLYYCPLCNGYMNNLWSFENYVQSLFQGGWACSVCSVSFLTYWQCQPRPEWAEGTEGPIILGLCTIAKWHSTLCSQMGWISDMVPVMG